jgi:hypothetical protein
MKFGVQFKKREKKNKMGALKPKALQLRFFQLTSDETTITWTGGTSSRVHRVKLYDIREYRQGFVTCAHSSSVPSLVSTSSVLSLVTPTSSKKEEKKEANEKKEKKQAKINEKKRLKEALSFSIIYGYNYQHINLIAPSNAYFQVWLRGLRHLMSTRSSILSSRISPTLLEECWKRADKNGDNALSKREVSSLLNHLNADFPSEKINTCWERAAPGVKGLNLVQFQQFYQLLTRRDDDMKPLIQSIVKEKREELCLTNLEFLNFLTNTQKVPHPIFHLDFVPACLFSSRTSFSNPIS